MITTKITNQIKKTFALYMFEMITFKVEGEVFFTTVHMV
jgi:hypothetical protein